LDVDGFFLAKRLNHPMMPDLAVNQKLYKFIDGTR
jgi:hypothetical protein